MPEIDDAYLGGERNGGKRGRGSENKQAFVVAVQTDATLEHPRYAVIEPVVTFEQPHDDRMGQTPAGS